MRTRRAFLQIVLAALLLFAQQAAVTHAIWHVHAPSHERHHDGQSKGSFQAGSCDWHGTFGQVLGGVAPGSSPHAGQRGPAEQAAAPVLPRVTALSLAPLSRGPPALL